MSFEQFSPELLMETLSHLLDIRTKIRLERVSRRFRDCTRNVESWEHNTTLKMSDFPTDEAMRSFLSRAKVVTTLELDSFRLSFKHFACLFMFSDKLKIRELSYNVDGSLNDNCSEYAPLVACCLGKFASTLESMNFECCGTVCPIVETLCSLLPFCANLRKLSLSYFRDHEDGHLNAADDHFQGDANDLFLLDALMNLSFSELHLINFFSTVAGERLAAVCNTSKNHTICTIDLSLTLGGDHPPGSMRFQLAQFCQMLEPEAARAVQSFKLCYIDCEWVDLLPTLPAVFPNLTLMEIMHVTNNSTVTDAMKIGESVGGFLHASGGHQQPLTLDLNIFSQQDGDEQERAFGHGLWTSVDLIDVWRSGTKRTADMTEWKRTLSHGNVTATIELW